MKRFYFLLVFIISQCAYAAEQLHIALPETSYPPYHLVAEEQNGLLVDVLQRFAQDTNIELLITYAPEVRSLKLVNEHRVDARMESKQWHRGEGKYYWSDEIIVVEDVIVMPHGSIFPDLKTCGNYILLGRHGYTYPALEGKEQSNLLHRENFYSEKEILDSLLADQNSQRFAVLAKESVNWYISNQPHYRRLQVSTYAIETAPLQLQFAYNDRGQKLSQQFNQFLKSLKNSGEFAKLIASYQ